MKRDFVRIKHPGIYAGALPGLELTATRSIAGFPAAVSGPRRS
jgi:hypothetical protein